MAIEVRVPALGESVTEATVATWFKKAGDTVAAVLALAILSTAVAYILYFRLLASAGPVNLLLVTLLIPVSAVLLGAAALGEALEPRHALGMAAIAGGLALIDRRLPRRLLAAARP